MVVTADQAAISGPTRGGKSQTAFRTISEVADELDVAQHVLRFWESKFPQVRPLKRGGGRRYYRPEDIELLREIRTLLYDEGYTIKGAQKLLRQRRVRPAAPPRATEKPSLPPVAQPPPPPGEAHEPKDVADPGGTSAGDPADGQVPPERADAVAAQPAAGPDDTARLRRLRDTLQTLRNELDLALAEADS